jgi:hypothetical protein
MLGALAADSQNARGYFISLSRTPNIGSYVLSADALLRSGFKTSYRAQVQGVDRRKNGAYMGVCEYFEEDHNTVIVC